MHPKALAAARGFLGHNGEQMAIERRRGQRRFLYARQVRRGRVSKRYLGSLSDPVTEILSRAQDLSGANSSAARAAIESELDEYAQLEPVIRLLATRVNRCVLRDKEKRRRRARTRPKEKRKPMMDASLDDTRESIGLTRDEFEHLVYRATSGSEDALAELHATLRANPTMYGRLGDLARHVQLCLVDLIAGDSVVAHESLHLNIDKMRSDLQRDGTSPLEALLVDQVVTSWLDLSVQQIGFAQDHCTEAIAKRHEQRVERAQGRHLRVVRALHELRNFT